MSSTTDPQVDPSAAARLADRKWRWKNSIWVFARALCLGFVSCAGFIYAANKVHNRKWTVYAVISTVVTLAVYCARSSSRPTITRSPTGRSTWSWCRGSCT